MFGRGTHSYYNSGARPWHEERGGGEYLPGEVASISTCSRKGHLGEVTHLTTDTGATSEIRLGTVLSWDKDGCRHRKAARVDLKVCRNKPWCQAHRWGGGGGGGGRGSAGGEGGGVG